jgi:soluble lytic murein transglycosylase-like protein
LTQSPFGAVRLLLHTGLVGFAALLSGCAGLGPTETSSVGAAPVAQPKPAKPAAVVVPSPVAAARPALPATAAPATAVPAPAPATAAFPPPVPAAAPEAVVVIAPMPTSAPQHRDLWDRMRAGFAMPELDSQLVQEKERFYAGKPETLQRMFSRGNRYLYYIVEEVEKRGMPTELALLPFVESAMNPVALSSAQAAGLWQFIPSTGRQYDLSQNWWVDNRRDVVQSTRAALDYLQKIYEMHDRDWFLALASYNWGARPAHQLPQPVDAGRDAQLRPQADRAEEHRAALAGIRRRPAGHPQPPLLRHAREDPPDRPEAGRPVRRHERRRVRGAESGA